MIVAAFCRPHPPRPRYPVPPVSALLLLLLAAVGGFGCRRSTTTAVPADPHLATNGTVEVTARLVEIPEGAIFQRDLYDYATVLQYQVLEVHRGQVEGPVLFIAHYNPWKPRTEAADKRAPGVGGNLRQFQAGQVHRLALAVPLEDHFMGGVVNKYFGRMTNAIYWALWTNRDAP